MKPISNHVSHAMLLAGLLVAPLSAQPEKRPMTLVDLLEVPSVSDPQLSPDGRHLLFVLAEPDWEMNGRVRHVWRADLNGGATIQLTNGPGGESSPRWSPDGKSIAFLAQRGQSRSPQVYLVNDLEKFERELHSLFATAEAEVVGHEVNRFDVDRPFVTVNGVVHHQVLRCEDTYFCASGPVQVMRSLYSTRKDSERAICPMELQAGLVEGRWTPHAAKQATWVVSHLTPGDGEELFQMFGGLKPSKSSLDRLPKQLGQRWERERIEFEDVLRAQERVPAEAVSMAVSLDGVMVPMKNGQRQTKRAKAAKEGKYTRGPAGNKEVGCGTLSFYDEEGERLATIRMARMPEVKKATLKVTLSKEVNSCLAERPDLKVVKVADGAKDNWTFLSGELPDGEEVIDFYHAAGHLDTALAVAYGDTHPKRSAQFKKLRHVLVEDDKGVEKVIRSLVHLRDTYPRRKKIARELKYFRRNRHRMRYAVLKKQGLPIGSGVTEAACKTLATQRLKRSGMRWGEQGGQAILSFRALVQSNRFERAWTLLAHTYKAEVTALDNVVPIRSWR